jgi:hypothetical protein
MEAWANITGYSGLYQVSTHGRVRRVMGSKFSKDKNRVLKNKTKKTGYKFVCLSKGGKYKYFHVHRLVAQEFIPNIGDCEQVNHKDCDKSNNTISNLEWVTSIENQKHARKNIVYDTTNMRRGSNHPKAYPIGQYLDDDLVMVWGSVSEATKHYVVSPSSVNRAVRKQTSSLGFRWKKITKDFFEENKTRFKNAPLITIDIKARDNKNALIAQGKRVKEQKSQ